MIISWLLILLFFTSSRYETSDWLFDADRHKTDYANMLCLCEIQRGDERAILSFLPNQATIADLDCHPNLPMSCSANQEGAISLWNMEGI